MSQTFKVSFTLDEDDTRYFRSLFRKARKAAGTLDEDEILRGAHELVREVRKARKVPQFVLEAMSTLEDLAQLVEDEDYKPPKNVRSQVLGALAYFANPGDLIPDHIPVFGFLDDALMIKLVEQEFKHELWGYRKFRKFREGAEQRPWTAIAGSRLPRRLADQRKRIRTQVDIRKKRDAGKVGRLF